mgnify:CR=1 FL=1
MQNIYLVSYIDKANIHMHVITCIVLKNYFQKTNNHKERNHDSRKPSIIESPQLLRALDFKEPSLDFEDPF